MINWKEIWKIINSARTSTYYAKNEVRVRDSAHFTGLSYSKQQEINLMLENEEKQARTNQLNGKSLESLDNVKNRSAQLVPLILNNYKTSKPVTATVRDAIGNLPTMSGVQGQDPATMNVVTQNLYISPWEASAIYSQKGLPETIINKKGKSPLLNGVHIRNPKLALEQLDKVQDDMLCNGLANKCVEGLVQALIYGGALMFPIFKRDSPVSMNLPVDVLANMGVIGKGCIDHWVVLDRWNSVHIPNWNPTSDDFLKPRYYYIPFLGTHVSGQRVARIVTAPQPGYWAVLATMGWGISDIPGWIEAVYNYCNVMSTIPTMIAQMSVLIRTINVDSYMATEGMDVLHNIDFETTVKIREASLNNPINMDVIGDVKALQRDFKEVPNLVRLVRQDVGAKSNLTEECMFSVERGAFSSGDPTAGAQEKQWENMKYLHKDVEAQLKGIAMLEIINALGKDRDILAALPYTTIEFANPVITGADKKAEVGSKLGKMAFDLTAARFPSDMCMELMQAYGGTEFNVKSEIYEDLKRRQKENDLWEKERHKKEMEQLDAEIELIKEQTKHVGDVGVGSTGGTSKGKKSSSSDAGYTRLEQRQHEKTRGTAATREGLQRAAGRKAK
jgi:hypothetical protein